MLQRTSRESLFNLLSQTAEEEVNVFLITALSQTHVNRGQHASLENSLKQSMRRNFDGHRVVRQEVDRLFKQDWTEKIVCLIFGTADLMFGLIPL